MRTRLWVILGLALTLLALAACGGLPGIAPAPPPTPTPNAGPVGPTATPTSVPVTPTPTQQFPGDGPWEVTFESAGGVMLHGTLYGRGEVGLVLAPTYPGEQQGWAWFAQAAAEQGYMALAFDFRGYGASEGERSLADAPADLAAAVAFLREQEASPIVLMGAGEGGMAAIKVAGADPDMAGLAVLSSARAVDGLELSDGDLAALSLPTLWIGARTDMEQAVEELFELAGGNDKELWIYEGNSQHGTYLFEGADADDLRRRLLEFAARAAGS